jgi:hypothetical protein
MSQPVKLSDALVLDARLAGEAQQRSIAGQVEFWAKLGKSVESMMEGRQVLALLQSGGTQPLSEALASVDSPAGRKRLTEYLAGRPFPHFQQHPTQAGLLVRIDEDGKRTVGRFVNRAFVAVQTRNKPSKEPIRGCTSSKKSPATRVKAKYVDRPKERAAWT